jgi:hypothetical protein
MSDPYYRNTSGQQPVDPRFTINNIEDPSESQATTHEQFLDEPNSADSYRHPNDHSPSRNGRHYPEDDDLRLEEEDPYRDSTRYQNDIPEQSQPPPRQFKHSTANLREEGKWKKWCKILLMFLLMIAFMIGLSMLFNHFFFGDKSDNGPAPPLPDRNDTNFAKNKEEIDSACGRKAIADDSGKLCQEVCAPQYFDCCDPFDEFRLYNYTQNATEANSTTKDDGKLTSNRYDEPHAKNTTFLDGYDDALGNATCTLDMDVRGCMSYAKCHALTGQTDPAPANLNEFFCAPDKLAKDPGSCQEICRKLDCCYSSGSDNCLAEKFDLCMDYAPCQNLRSLENNQGVLEVAPRTLDYDCYFQQQACTDTCEKARCCSESLDFACFQYNFLSCLTYSPCTNVTEVNIVLPPQFSVVPQPTIDLINACQAPKENGTLLEPSDRSCEEICTDAACCWSGADGNCFAQDPLGCLAYDAQCQVLQP